MSPRIILLLAVLLPSVASAQLTIKERVRAEELARIQAKANAREQVKAEAEHRQTRRDMAQANCRSSNRRWDYVNNTCVPR